MSLLFDAIKFGAITAKNRIFMAPLTRGRATKDGVPTDIMLDYYKERASTGLIISEATGISRQGLGWPWAPGIYTEEQINEWKKITKAVHDQDGKIVLQLWHMGYATHSSVIGEQPVSASAVAQPGQVHTFDGKKDAEVARPLSKEEIKGIVQDYAQAAKNAITAGFDGVQIHAANGYLIDQFLRDSTNKRTDEYGGSIENRLRFLKEVTTAVISAVGVDKTFVRLSPNGPSLGVIDSNHVELFTAAGKLLNDLKVPMVELRQSSKDTSLGGTTDQKQVHNEFREVYKGTLVLNQDFTKETANDAIKNGIADAISFGRPFIGNPDLVEKFKKNIPLNHYERHWETLFARGPVGYTEFPKDIYGKHE